MLPPDTLDRLGKLIPLLGSDKDGEVVATARAIDRALRAAGTDLHGLAAAVTGTRSGWVPGRYRRSASSAPGPFSYANAFKEAKPLFDGPEHPEALTRRFGLPIYAEGIVESWPTVARHCLLLNQTLPKKHGGKFLQDWQKKLLRTLVEDGRQPSNRHVAWIETVVARLHQARDAAARATA